MRMSTQKLRIVFMGTPDFATTALEILHTSGHEIVCVYTQPPRPKGRGQQVQPSPVHQYAADHGILVRHPRSLKKKHAQEEFAELKPDVAVVAAYGLILPKAILEAPLYGCLNIHASLLPRWRGASPIQRAILEGDKESGITIMQMDEGLDTGPMILKRSLKIRTKTTASSLHDALSGLGAAMAEEVVNMLARGDDLNEQIQDDKLSTYAPLLTKEDGRINWSETAEQIDRQIRALNPWPGVWSKKKGQRFKILEAILAEEKTDERTGLLLDRKGNMACGNGSILKILKIQPPGKKAMDMSSAINGGYLKIGEHFS